MYGHECFPPAKKLHVEEIAQNPKFRRENKIPLSSPISFKVWKVEHELVNRLCGNIPTAGVRKTTKTNPQDMESSGCQSINDHVSSHSSRKMTKTNPRMWKSAAVNLSIMIKYLPFSVYPSGLHCFFYIPSSQTHSTTQNRATSLSLIVISLPPTQKTSSAVFVRAMPFLREVSSGQR